MTDEQYRKLADAIYYDLLNKGVVLDVDHFYAILKILKQEMQNTKK